MATEALKQSREATGIVRLAVLAYALALALATPSARALDAKPHIVVNFGIEAPAFKRNLPELADAEQAIATQIAAQIAERYAFADWTVAPRDATSRLGSLILRLEEDATTVPNPRIVVAWYRESVDAADAVKLAIPETEIYAPTNPNWDTNSRRNLQTRVLDKLSQSMRADNFYDSLFTLFLRTLPIATSASAEADNHAVAMPLGWREMLLAPESVVIVRFVKHGDAQTESGSLRLNPVAPQIVPPDSADAPSTTLLLGAVSAATLGIHTLALTANWNDQLPALLQGADVRCYLVDYKPVEFAGTSDGLVLDPGL